jgi:hypothetical protein
VERVMGIENTAGAHLPFGIMKLQLGVWSEGMKVERESDGLR